MAHAELWQEIKASGLLNPLLPYLRDFVATVDPNKRALIVEDACEWLAAQVGERAGFDTIARVTKVLQTKDGEEFVRWCLYRSECP